MREFEKEIRELYETVYTDEPKVGDWVIVKNDYHETTISGEVEGLKHSNPSRGFHPDANFEFVVYGEYSLKIAGIKGWLPMDKWELLTILPEFEHKKLAKKEREIE